MFSFIWFYYLIEHVYRGVNQTRLFCGIVALDTYPYVGCKHLLIMASSMEDSLSEEIGLYEPCISGKHHRTPFEKRNCHSTVPLGIVHRRVMSRQYPEQNGIAERMNRTLVESVRLMLSNVKLPHTFWAEALSTADYLQNRSPTKAVCGKTPYEAWTGGKPTVSHLCVFGCKAYVHIPKDERGKLDCKAKCCVLVGYGEETKGIGCMTKAGKSAFSVKTWFSTRMSVDLNVILLSQEENHIRQEKYASIVSSFWHTRLISWRRARMVGIP